MEVDAVLVWHQKYSISGPNRVLQKLSDAREWSYHVTWVYSRASDVLPFPNDA
jgi:hypothetical protein